MKRMKKIVSMLLAVIMVLGMCITASAEENCSITIKNNNDGVTVTGKTFIAYQILEAELANGTDAEGGVIYKVPAALADFYAGKFGLDKTATGFNGAVVEKISAMSASELEQFAKDALAAAKEAGDDEIATGRVSVSEYLADAEGDYWELADGSYTDVAPGAEDGERYASTEQKYALNTQTEAKIDNLPLGYYVVEDVGAATPVSALALTSAVPNAQVVIKASQPGIDKKIDGNLDSNGINDGLVENNEVAIGDTVPFQINSNVPNMSGYKQYYFVVTDRWDEGLTFNPGSMNITIDGKDIERTDDSTADGQVYTLIMYKDASCSEESITTNASEARAFKIIFHNFIQYKELTKPEDGVVESAGGAPIVIKYNATLNDKANIGVTGNQNSADLEFSNDPNTEPDGDPDEPYNPGKDPHRPTGITPESITRTFVTGIELLKVDTASGKPLTGATFTISGERINQIQVTEDVFSAVVATEENPLVKYWKNAEGEYTTIKPENSDVAYTRIVNEDETVEYRELYWKLKNGTYTTDAPVKSVEADAENNIAGIDGSEDLYDDLEKLYTKSENTYMSSDVEGITFTGTVDELGVLKVDGLAAGNYVITETVAPNGYNILAKPIYITIGWTAPVSNSEGCTWTVVKTADTDGIDSGAAVENGVITMTIGNSFGALLPSTGGIGTTIFYVVGGILVLAAVVLLVTKKRMSAEK